MHVANDDTLTDTEIVDPDRLPTNGELSPKVPLSVLADVIRPVTVSHVHPGAFAVGVNTKVEPTAMEEYEAEH